MSTLTETEVRCLVVRSGDWELVGETGEGGEKVWNSRCKINKYKDVMYVAAVVVSR